MTADIFADAEAFRAACADGQLLVPMTADGGNLERASGMIEALRIPGPVLILECDGLSLEHGEGEGCEACDGERLRQESKRRARERERGHIRFDTTAVCDSGRLVIADMSLEPAVRDKLAERWIARPVEIIECDRASCTLAGARCIGCPEE